MPRDTGRMQFPKVARQVAQMDVKQGALKGSTSAGDSLQFGTEPQEIGTLPGAVGGGGPGAGKHFFVMGVDSLDDAPGDWVLG